MSKLTFSLDLLLVVSLLLGVCKGEEEIVFSDCTVPRCSVTCGRGVATQTVPCTEEGCTGDIVRTFPCELQPCEVYSPWEFGSCSAACGSTGVRIDVRTCFQGVCTESLTREVSCESECSLYSEWEMGACSSTCGAGFQVAVRDCLQGDCTGDLVEVFPCEGAC